MNQVFSFLLASILCVTSFNVYSIDSGYTHEYEYSLLPSMPYTFPQINKKEGVIKKKYSYHSCYSAHDGRPLDCPFVQMVYKMDESYLAPENNGGHTGAEHNQEDRNLVYNGEHLEYFGDKDPSPNVVMGSTKFIDAYPVATVIHKLPMASGKFMEETYVSSPRGWTCTDYCYTRTSRRYLYTHSVGIRDLEKFPAENTESFYQRVRSADTNHDFEEAYYGLSSTNQILKAIAENYYYLSNKKLSINDMSLRKGGVFDIKGKWTKPHSTHRQGKDVDINRDGTNCKDDRDLFIATGMFLTRGNKEAYHPYGGGVVYSPINCEPIYINGVKTEGYKKHIDFEMEYDGKYGTGAFY
ncbi:MAG: hypothetical protein OQJ77_04210 [Thiovulaceae bacterium]|nr:hypothetical protein [Sulfurimonadaceae bacterium]